MIIQLPHDLEVVRRARAQIEDESGAEISFPLSLMPVGIDRALMGRLVQASEAFHALASTPAYLREAADWVPDRYQPAGGHTFQPPTIEIYDFVLVDVGDGRIEPRLLECQGAPSLNGVIPRYGWLLAQEMLGGRFTPFVDGHRTWDDYVETARAIQGRSILVDIDPPTQKFRTDFGVHRAFFGCQVSDMAPRRFARRVCNRVVPIEPESKGRGDEFGEYLRENTDNFTHDPFWTFGLCKRSLPILGTVSDLVPATEVLDPESATRWSGDAETRPFIIKPVDDFGAHGVVLEPKPADIEAALAENQRTGRVYLLQERVTLAPVVDTPTGMRFLEVRTMLMDGKVVATLCRIAKSPLVNVSYQGGDPWCGMAPGLVPVEA